MHTCTYIHSSTWFLNGKCSLTALTVTHQKPYFKEGFKIENLTKYSFAFSHSPKHYPF